MRSARGPPPLPPPLLAVTLAAERAPMEVSWERRLAWGIPAAAILAARLGIKECLGTRLGGKTTFWSSCDVSSFMSTKRALLSRGRRHFTREGQVTEEKMVRTFISTLFFQLSMVQWLVVTQSINWLELLVTKLTDELLVRIAVNITHMDLETPFRLRNCPTNSTGKIWGQPVFLNI